MRKKSSEAYWYILKAFTASTIDVWFCYSKCYMNKIKIVSMTLCDPSDVIAESYNYIIHSIYVIRDVSF